MTEKHPSRLLKRLVNLTLIFLLTKTQKETPSFTAMKWSWISIGMEVMAKLKLQRFMAKLLDRR